MASSRTIPPHHWVGGWEGLTDFQKNLKAGDFARIKYTSLMSSFSYSHGYYELHNEIVQVEKIEPYPDRDIWPYRDIVVIKGGKKLKLWDLYPATDNPFEVSGWFLVVASEMQLKPHGERHVYFQVDVPGSVVIDVCSLDSPDNDPTVCLPMKYGGDLLIHLVDDAGLEQFKQRKKVDSFLSATFYGDRSFECSVPSGTYHLIVVNYINYRSVVVNCSVEQVLSEKEKYDD